MKMNFSTMDSSAPFAYPTLEHTGDESYLQHFTFVKCVKPIRMFMLFYCMLLYWKMSPLLKTVLFNCQMQQKRMQKQVWSLVGLMLSENVGHEKIESSFCFHCYLYCDLLIMCVAGSSKLPSKYFLELPPQKKNLASLQCTCSKISDISLVTFIMM